MLLLLNSGTSAAAAAHGEQDEAAEYPCVTAAAVAQAAQHICGGTPTADALRSVRLREAAKSLSAHRLVTA